MLTRWDPFAELNRLSTDANRFFGERPSFQPAVDILEEDEGIVLEVEVPGMRSEDVQVHVENDLLTLSGERRVEKEEKKGRYHRIERSYGRFSRAFILPKNVDGDAIEAKLEDGILRLRLPKRPSPERRRVEIAT